MLNQNLQLKVVLFEKNSKKTGKTKKRNNNIYNSFNTVRAKNDEFIFNNFRKVFFSLYQKLLNLNKQLIPWIKRWKKENLKQKLKEYY